MAGAINDHWLLGAAAAIAETPSRIQKLFRNSEYSAEGIFEVIVNVENEHQHVVIDDRLPVDQDHLLVNASPTGDSWWMVLLEKAFAKLNVNYSNLQGGSPIEALRQLTGMPVVTYHTKLMTEADLKA